MKNSSSKSGILISAIRAQIVVLITAAILLTVFCAVAYSTDDPDSLIIPLSLCALYLSAISGGIAAVRFSGDGIVSGLLSGAISMAAVFLISLLPLHPSGFDSTMGLILTALTVPASAAGSVIGHKKKERAAGKAPVKRHMQKNR